MIIPFPYHMVDMGGIDLAEANGTVVEGLYERIEEGLNSCGEAIFYNWKFAEIEIVPSTVEVLVLSDEFRINGLIQVTIDDVVTVLGIAPPPVPVTPLAVTENGIYEAQLPVYGFSPVTVNVETGALILSGMAYPESQVGENGQLYLVYTQDEHPVSELPAAFYNLNNWTKNAAAFPVFDNEYSANGENVLEHRGGNGYERIFIELNVEEDTEYNFALDYYTPSGSPGGYGGQLNIKASFATAQQMASSNELSSYAVYQNLSIQQASQYSHYLITFNTNNHSTVYLVIDLNISDGRLVTLKFRNLAFYKTGESPTVVTLYPVVDSLCKVDGQWGSLIGTNIEDISSEHTPSESENEWYHFSDDETYGD